MEMGQIVIADYAGKTNLNSFLQRRTLCTEKEIICTL